MITTMPSKNLIGRPHITEKAERMKGENKFTFVVERNAVKNEIKKLIEKTHKVNVMAVNIVSLSRPRKGEARRSFAKKAIVTLKAGQTINEKV